MLSTDQLLNAVYMLRESGATFTPDEKESLLKRLSGTALMPQGYGTSRLDRALRLLRVDRDAPAATLAEALLLASYLPVEAIVPPDPDPTNKKQKQPEADRSGKRPGGATASVTSTERKDKDAEATVYSGTKAGPDEAFIPATFISVPAADPLPARLAIERALKPFLKRVFSQRLTRLDVDRTAEASAERRAITPIFEPVPERWFDVMLLVEQSDAMEIWAETVRALSTLLGHHGAFRNVRTIRFAVSDNELRLTSGGQPFPLRAAFEPEGRRLCLVLTNGTGEEWRAGPLLDFLRALGARSAVAIVQMPAEKRLG